MHKNSATVENKNLIKSKRKSVAKKKKKKKKSWCHMMFMQRILFFFFLMQGLFNDLDLKLNTVMFSHLSKAMVQDGEVFKTPVFLFNKLYSIFL